MTNTQIWMQGYLAARSGTKWWNNPHPSGSVDAYTWDQGHTRYRIYGALTVAA